MTVQDTRVTLFIIQKAESGDCEDIAMTIAIPNSEISVAAELRNAFLKIS